MRVQRPFRKEPAAMGVLREAKSVASEGVTAPSPPRPALTRVDTLVDSYRRLADVFHDVLSAERLNTLLERIADTLGDLVPYDTFTIYQADEARRCLIPLMARDTWADEIMRDRPLFGQGITGWAVEHREPQLVNQAHLDPRVKVVPGTPPDEPEALITIPLVARDAIKGALNIYRLGEKARFTEEEFELAQRFGDIAALALDNVLRGSLRLSDVVCRLGGEEFGIIMTACSTDDALALAERLLERMRLAT